MKKLSICVALLIMLAVAIFVMRRSPNGNQLLEISSAPEAEIEEEFNADDAINEVPKDSQVSNLALPLELKTQQEVFVPIVVSSQIATNNSHTKNEVSINMPEHEETISVLDKKYRRFVRIAFERAKDVMEITDTSAVTVEYKDNIAIVTFPFPHQAMGNRPPYPGPDYLVQVKIDCSTDRVLEILGAP